MAKTFFDNPILNGPYELPEKHRETNADNQPTGKIVQSWRPLSLRSPIPSFSLNSIHTITHE